MAGDRRARRARLSRRCGASPTAGSRRVRRLYWDVLGLYRETLAGIREAGAARRRSASTPGPSTTGCSTRRARCSATPCTTATPRTDGSRARYPTGSSTTSPGVQQLPFNTLYQLVRRRTTGSTRRATMLLIPDLLNYWLTGVIGARTHERVDHRSSTTSARGPGRLSLALAGRASRPGCCRRCATRARSVGTARELAGVPVIAVGSHDTASAVVAVPASPGTNFAYISSARGRWRAWSCPRRC